MESFTVFQAFKFMDTDPALAEHIRMLPTARMAQQEARKPERNRFTISVPTGYRLTLS